MGGYGGGSRGRWPEKAEMQRQERGAVPKPRGEFVCHPTITIPLVNQTF
jgi:hypothetical protein